MIRVPTLALLFLAGSAAAQQALSTTFGPTPGGLTGEMVAVATDFDGDGTADLLVTSRGIGQGLIQVVSGATNTVRTLSNPGTSTFPYRVLLGVPDLDLDGRGDLVVDTNGSLRAYSGATLALRWATTGSQYAIAAPVGDRNGDGRCDIAAVTEGNPGELRVLSGLDGAPFATYPLTYGSGLALQAIGDQNGDGVPELARLQAGGTQILRLANPPVLLTIPIAGATIAAANVAGDSRLEVLVGDSFGHVVRACNATTGATVRTWNQAYQGVFAVVGDLDADLVPDLALRTAAYDVRFVSGASGADLAYWPASPQFPTEQLAGGVDQNGDGFGDLLLGATQAHATGATGTATGGWQRLSGRILATMAAKPTACAQGPFFPVLGVTRPILGQVATIAGQNAPAGTVGFVAFSLQPPLPTNLGVAGCDAWFDVSGGSLLQTTTTPAWQFGFPVPPAPQLAGVRIALQAFYVPTFSAIGIDVTNGIWATLGY